MRRHQGGNSHQRKVSKTKAERQSLANAPVQRSLPPAPSQLQEPRWYQSTLFWGLVSMAVAIVLTVVAAMKRDIRWLIWIVWPLLSFATLEFLSYWKIQKERLIYFVLLMVAILGFLTYAFNAWLRLQNIRIIAADYLANVGDRPRFTVAIQNTSEEPISFSSYYDMTLIRNFQEKDTPKYEQSIFDGLLQVISKTPPDKAYRLTLSPHVPKTLTSEINSALDANTEKCLKDQKCAFYIAGRIMYGKRMVDYCLLGFDSFRALICHSHNTD